MRHKKIVFCISLILCINSSSAQNLKINYGAHFGINGSSMGSRSYISDVYLMFPSTSIRNLTLNTSSNTNFGYNTGIFINVEPKHTPLILETGLFVSTYNNSYLISVDWEQYYATTGSYWGPINETERFNNEFSVINIPVTIGYDLLRNENFKIILLCGLTNNVNMKKEQIRFDQQLNEVTLFKEFFLSYHTGVSVEYKRLFCRIKFDRSFNIKRANSSGYIPYLSMNVEKLFINSVSLSFGIRLNS